MSASILPAAGENKRILRELLAKQTWTRHDFAMYDEVLRRESLRVTRKMQDRFWQDLEADQIAEKHRVADQLGIKIRYVPRPKLSPGEIARNRRRERREAVTSGDGARAVTTGPVWDCIVCGEKIPRLIPTRRYGVGRFKRRDSAYCSNACRQRAYRGRNGKP